MIIAIDGPAGSGKSTTARAIASRLGYMYLDTGAMYRTIALWSIETHTDLTTNEGQHRLQAIRVGLQETAGEVRVLLNDRDVTDLIRTPEISAGASQVSRLAPVREKLVAEQRRIAREEEAKGRGVVLDGRDIGTVVFPDADLKVFMVAGLRERAERRYEELRIRGINTTLSAVESEIAERDRQDSARAIAPLRKAEDAVEIDTTRCTIAQQVDLVLRYIAERSENR